MKKFLVMFLIAVLLCVVGCSTNNGNNIDNSVIDSHLNTNENEIIKLDKYLNNVMSIEIISGENVSKTLDKDDSEFLELVNDLKALDYRRTEPLEGKSYYYIRLNYGKNNYAIIDCSFVKICNNGVSKIENIYCKESQYTEIIAKYIVLHKPQN